MSAATFEARAVAAYLSLNVEIHDDDHGRGLLTYRLLALTGLLFWLSAAWEAGLSAMLAVARWFDRVAARLERWRLYWQLAGIGLRALCWGVAR